MLLLLVKGPVYTAFALGSCSSSSICGLTFRQMCFCQQASPDGQQCCFGTAVVFLPPSHESNLSSVKDSAGRHMPGVTLWSVSGVRWNGKGIPESFGEIRNQMHS